MYPVSYIEIKTQFNNYEEEERHAIDLCQTIGENLKKLQSTEAYMDTMKDCVSKKMYDSLLTHKPDERRIDFKHFIESC